MKLRDLRQTQQDAYIQEMSELFTAYGQYKTMLSEGQLDEAGAWDAVKSIVGKGISGVKTANDAVNKLGQLAQTTGPVQGFDAKVDGVLNKIGNANPKVAELAKKYGEWAKKNPVKQGLIIGMLTAVATLVSGPGGGAAAGYVLRAGNELLKGEKASTALGRGAKTAAVGGALGWLAGAPIQAIGDAFKAAEPIMEPLKQLNDLARLKIQSTFNGRPLLNINQIFPTKVADQINKLSSQLGKEIIDDQNKAVDTLMKIQSLVNDKGIAAKVETLLAQNNAINAQNDAIQAAYDAKAQQVAQTNSQIQNMINWVKGAASGAIQGAAASGLADKAVDAGSKIGTGTPAAKAAPAAKAPAAKSAAAQPAAATPDKRAELKAKQQAWQAQQRRMGKLK